MGTLMAMQESVCLKTCRPKLMSFLISWKGSTSLPRASQGDLGMLLLLELAALSSA